jgi:hypothetical protein
VEGTVVQLGRALIVFFLCLVSSAAHAQRVEITSPLENHVRSGRTTAIQISADGLTGQTLSLTGTGVIAVSLPISDGKIDAVIPLIAQGEPLAEVTWTDGAASGTVAISPRVLETDERLIVIAGNPAGATELISELFPGKRPVLIHLDLTRSKLLQPAMAFESVDAVLLDMAAAARLDEGHLRTMLAAGTVIAIDSPRALPDWPWQKRHNWSVLQHEVAGPRSGAEPEIYKPTATWDTTWPQPQRTTILIAAAVAAIVIVGLTLLRSRIIALIATAAACAGLAVGVTIYCSKLPSVATAGGEVMSWNGSLAQHDRYTFFSAKKETTAQISASEGITKPVLWQRRPIAGLSFKLICGAGGNPLRYDVTMPARYKVAFLSRSVGPDAPPAGIDTRVTAPIGLFADQLYPGTMTGQLMTAPADIPQEQWWGMVLMTRK